MLRHLLMSDMLADSSEYRHGNMVFFDVLGVVVVAYPARVGTILNYVVATAAFLYLAKKASLPGNAGMLPLPLDWIHVVPFLSRVCVFCTLPSLLFKGLLLCCFILMPACLRLGSSRQAAIYYSQFCSWIECKKFLDCVMKFWTSRQG